MFESQYNDEMAAEERRLEAKKRAAMAGHPEWLNACKDCAQELTTLESEMCDNCRSRVGRVQVCRGTGSVT